jgi:hypothetical protein
VKQFLKDNPDVFAKLDKQLRDHLGLNRIAAMAEAVDMEKPERIPEKAPEKALAAAGRRG